MKPVTTVLTAALCAVLLSSAALADWDPGDGHKMHWPQLPDPDGWDVKFDDQLILADDWECSETGTVEDIHFWFSSHDDLLNQVQPPPLLNVHASIHSDIKAVPGVSHSMPGTLLWERDFTLTDTQVRLWGTGDQGWYDPTQPPSAAIPNDHFEIWQANITGITDPFIQQEGTIYWLDLTVSIPTGPVPVELGWKTTRDHWNDDAVWWDGANWLELFDPIVQPPESLDLAFVITGRSTPVIPEPGSAALLLLGAAGLVRRRRRA